MQGYNVQCCNTGSSIVELKHSWPDLFILDRELPSIDGIAIAKFLRIHNVTKEIPIIMISAYPLKKKEEQVGIDLVVQKPFDPGTLLSFVERYIHKKERESFSS